MDATTPLTRRRTVTAAGTACLALAGCLGDEGGSEDPPDPVDLSGGKRDDEGGMVIGEHFGPNGQVFYEEHSPEGHDGPAWFHTLVAGLFPYHFRQERRGRTAVVIYATDYSRVAYELTDREDRTHISSHTAAESFAPATELQYVAGSGVLGGMGAELLPFGEPTDAEAFADDHGGRVVEFEEIDREFIREYR